jgi:hypothetical protein
MTSQLVPVQFVNRYTLYNVGEVAGFEASTSAQLISKGIAVPFTSVPPLYVEDAPVKRRGGRPRKVLEPQEADSPTDEDADQDSEDEQGSGVLHSLPVEESSIIETPPDNKPLG